MAKEKIIKKNKASKGKEIMRSLDKENSISIKKAVIVLVSVLIVIAIVYFVAAIIMGEIKFKEEKEVNEIQYETILAGSTFKKKDKEYIVVYYDFNGNDASGLDSTITTYKEQSKAKALYKVDLSLKQNASYQTETTSNKNPKTAKDLKVKGPTLIHICDGKIKTYIEGKDKIQDYLK